MTAKTPETPEPRTSPETEATPTSAAKSVPAPTTPAKAAPAVAPAPTATPQPAAPPSTAAPSTAAPSTPAPSPAKAATAPSTPAPSAPVKSAPAPSGPVKSTAVKAAGSVGPPKAAGAAGPPKATRPVARASRPNGGMAGGLAFVTAVCAVLVAAGSIAVAIYALDVAREAKSNAAIAMGGRSPITVPPTTPSQVENPASTPPTTTPTISAHPAYLIDQLQTELRLPAPEGCISVFVDLDTLHVGVDDGHDLYATSCQGTLIFRVDRASAVPMHEVVTTPEQCAEALSKETPGQETVIPVQPGVLACLLTSAKDAQRQLIPQRIAILEVRSLNATDRSISLVVSTYRVPV